MTYVVSILAVACAGLLYWALYSSINLKSKVEEIKKILDLKHELELEMSARELEFSAAITELNDMATIAANNYNADICAEKERYNKLLSQKKSSEVRLGQISEHVAPFMNSWPYDPKNFRFIGSPIDGIIFEDDKVVFVEIKTGKSRLTEKQRTIKKVIEDKNVEFMTFKIEEDEVRIS